MEYIEEYDILSAYDQKALVKLVNEKIKLGWEPYGSMVTVVWNDNGEDARIEYNQPMHLTPR